jgi:glycosyltransferase involved in cell wall biosynthesis
VTGRIRITHWRRISSTARSANSGSYTSSAPLGGLFRHVVDLAGEQTARGHDVGMFFDSEGLSPRVDEALATIPGGLRLRVETARIRRYPGPSDCLALTRFGRWLSGVSPHVVHGHGSKGGALARLTRIAGCAPDAVRAYTPHGGSFNYRPGGAFHRFYMTVERLLTPLTDVFLFESAFIASRFDAEVGDETLLRRIVVNGLRPSEFQPVAPNADAAEFVYIGELRAVKGVDILLEATARLAARTRPPRLVLVGSGPEKDRFKELARSIGVLDRVSFPGVMSFRKAMALGRILVAPSRLESLPYVVLEAAVVGGGDLGGQVLRGLKTADPAELRILGVFDDRSDARSPVFVEGFQKLGMVDDLVDFARSSRVDLVIFALPITAEKRILTMLRKLCVLPVDIRLAAHANHLRFRPRSYSYVGGLPVLDILDRPIADWNVVIKFVFDKVVGSLALID